MLDITKSISCDIHISCGRYCRIRQANMREHILIIAIYQGFKFKGNNWIYIILNFSISKINL